MQRSALRLLLISSRINSRLSANLCRHQIPSLSSLSSVRWSSTVGHTISRPLQPLHSQKSHNCPVCSYRRSILRYFSGPATVFASPAIMSAAADTKLPESSFRLARDILPTHYDLTIKTDLEALSFSGKVEIELEVHNKPESISSITLHAAPQLKVQAAVLSSSSLKTTSSVLASNISRDEKLERITVSFPTDVVSLEAGQKLKLGLRFDAELEGSMMGYYKSAYETAEGKSAFYGLTQFEATAARRAFPCFDEPDIKATVSFTHISKAGLVSLANMPAESVKEGISEIAPFQEELVNEAHAAPASQSNSSQWQAITFGKTPKISTYLVAWANGDFKHLESSYTSPLSGRKVPLRIYATQEHIHQAQLALDVKVKVLPVYEKIFDIEYPLPKLDTLVASDFDAGAMENWGLITGRTIVYLFDEKNGSIDAKKLVATVQSHEVAHQWFGNVVTMRWWDNLWLNEAFATLMGEVISIAAVWPEWNPHSSFLNAHLRRALELDSQRSSHPVEMPCPDPEMISQIFDAISYSKGASVLRMLSNMIGEETFLKGVSIYLKNHLYGNSRTADLWKGISQSSGQDVAKIMANWTLKVGFPVISVEETADGLKVKQNRFLSTGDPKPEEDETLWYVPLELKTVDKSGKVSVDHKAILEGRETVLPLEHAAKATYKLNGESAGVYRVLYSPDRLTKLGDEAGKGNKGAFSLNDRIGLVQDACVLAKSGYGKTSGALNLVSKLKNEDENLVWREVASGLGDISDVWWDQPEQVRTGLDKLTIDTFKPLAKKLGWEISDSDSSDNRELRVTAIAAIARSGEEEALTEVRRRFALYTEQNDPSAIPGDFLDLILANAVRYGGETEYERVLAIYRKPATPQHKAAAMRALCAARDSRLLDRTFTFMKTDEVKMQDAMYFYGGLAMNRLSRRRLWTELQQDLPQLVIKYKGNFSLGRLVQYSFDRLTTKEDEKAVMAYFSEKDTKDYKQSLQQGLDAVRAKTAWLARDTSDVEQWLKANGY